MTDAVTTGAGAGEVTGGEVTGAEVTGGESQSPEWMAGLPDDLKGDATLTRYKSLDDLARGHLETKKLASSKLIIPGDGATDEDWGKFYDALGRPESPDKYE